ncbi:hypothetical protein D9611_009764 [Ephemerocybe angulata]|uniref:Protein kinase domain-containing protein n=1 Tax=Ephemerocybe angulata TaxID=980116 RepID=A0A8H5CCU6_9AGAR|nr:hypothetical protein D9611_009764 [Tulosesus angulatus]
MGDQGSPLLTDIGLWRLESHPLSYSEDASLYKSRWMASELMDPRIAKVDGGIMNGEDSEPDTRSDVYSFGMTALELSAPLRKGNVPSDTRVPRLSTMKSGEF